jgi:hypothetical protein
MFLSELPLASLGRQNLVYLVAEDFGKKLMCVIGGTLMESRQSEL